MLYKMITIGFDIENIDLVEQWLEACHCYLDEEDEIPFPDCDVEVHFGGQPIYYYVVSVE